MQLLQILAGAPATEGDTRPRNLEDTNLPEDDAFMALIDGQVWPAPAAGPLERPAIMGASPPQDHPPYPSTDAPADTAQPSMATIAFSGGPAGSAETKSTVPPMAQAPGTPDLADAVDLRGPRDQGVRSPDEAAPPVRSVANLHMSDAPQLQDARRSDRPSAAPTPASLDQSLAAGKPLATQLTGTGTDSEIVKSGQSPLPQTPVPPSEAEKVVILPLPHADHRVSGRVAGLPSLEPDKIASQGMRDAATPAASSDRPVPAGSVPPALPVTRATVPHHVAKSEIPTLPPVARAPERRPDHPGGVLQTDTPKALPQVYSAQSPAPSAPLAPARQGPVVQDDVAMPTAQGAAAGIRAPDLLQAENQALHTHGSQPKTQPDILARPSLSPFTDGPDPTHQTDPATLPVAGGAHGDPAPRPAMAVPGPSLPPATVQHLARELANLAPETPLELTLDPPELGRIRVVLVPGEGGPILQIGVDRNETLELMRRHADQLAAELGDEGLGNAGFSFSRNPDQARPDPAASTEPEIAPVLSEREVQHVHTTRNGTLDLRL